MKTKEIKNKTKEELERLLGEKMLSLHEFRFGLAGSKTRNLKEGKNLKKEMARIKTELRSKK